MYGVAGFQAADGAYSGRLLSGLGTIEVQKLGCMMRGSDRKRECGSDGASSAKDRACGRVTGNSAVRQKAGTPSSWRRVWVELIVADRGDGMGA